MPALFGDVARVEKAEDYITPGQLRAREAYARRLLRQPPAAPPPPATPVAASTESVLATLGKQPAAALARVEEENALYYRPKWKLKKVIAGHSGWVRTIDVDISNEWFVSSGNDRLIKIWDLASGELKLTLTGHVHAVRSLKLHTKRPYLFSCGEDHTIKCWDLEQNQVVRQYHGHLSGVYSLALHPSLDLLVSGGRDSVVRVWDLRTREEVFCLQGHSSTVFSLIAQDIEPQVVSGSADKMIRCWDLRKGVCASVNTHHAKSVRALAAHPRLWSFVSGAADAVKCWHGSKGEYERDFAPPNTIVNSLAVKDDPESSTVVAGTDSGLLLFYDYHTGQCYQRLESTPIRGSLQSETGVLCTVFDQSETRLLTGECDKTIRIWEERTPMEEAAQ